MVYPTLPASFFNGVSRIRQYFDQPIPLIALDFNYPPFDRSADSTLRL